MAYRSRRTRRSTSTRRSARSYGGQRRAAPRRSARRSSARRGTQTVRIVVQHTGMTGMAAAPNSLGKSANMPVRAKF